MGYSASNKDARSRKMNNAINDGEIIVLGQTDRSLVSAVYSGEDNGWALFEVDFARMTSRVSQVYGSFIEARYAARIGAVRWV